MSEILTTEAYEQAKTKLRDLETRLAALNQRVNLKPAHQASVRRSYTMMMREFLRNIKLYEANHGKQNPTPRM